MNIGTIASYLFVAVLFIVFGALALAPFILSSDLSSKERIDRDTDFD